MKKVIQLSKLEFEKIWRNRMSKVSIFIIILFCLISALLYSKINKISESINGSSVTWQEQLHKDSEMLGDFEKQDDKYTDFLGSDSIMAQRTINEYRLNNNLMPVETLWEMSFKIINSAFKVLLIFICIISVNSILSEYQEGTIKQLLIKPYRRSEILFSKLIGAFIFSVFLLLAIFLTALIIEGISNKAYDFNYLFIGYFSGKIFVTEYYLYALLSFGLYMLVLMLSISLCFTVSLITQSKNLSLIIALIFLLFGSAISRSLFKCFNFIKFTFLNNLNLIEYFNYGRNNGVNFYQSIILIALNILVLNIISAFLFKRKEIYN